MRGLLISAALAGALVASCGPVPDESSAADSASQRVVADASPAASAPATAKLDMTAIFPPGEGRDLVLDNCMSCHGFVRFVLLQRTRDQWAYVRRVMRPYVAHLDDRQAEALFGYLERHFNDSTPAPVLPDWFLETLAW